MKPYDPNSSQKDDLECSLCGRDGGPYQGCGDCHGAAGVQSRAYSLSDIRSGRAKPKPRGGDGPFASTNLPEYDPYS